MMLEKVSVLFVVMLLVAGLVGVVFGSGSDTGEQVADGVEERLTSGSGTLDDPYMIYDVYDLQNMTANLTAHYALANDIDASETGGGGTGTVQLIMGSSQLEIIQIHIGIIPNKDLFIQMLLKAA